MSMEGNGTGETGLVGDGHQFDPNTLALNNNNNRVNDADYDSRSGSDNFEAPSGDEELLEPDQDQQHPNKKKKKYHRHTQRQIVELENFFKENPHPDDKQRMELSRKLGLASNQIKFWFQNRRTQMKAQLERHENIILRQDNDKLRAENALLRQSITDPLCSACGGPVLPSAAAAATGPADASLEHQQLMLENARLKEELSRVCSLANKFLGRPLSSSAAVNPSPVLVPPPTSRLGFGNGFGPVSSMLAAGGGGGGLDFGHHPMSSSIHQDQYVNNNYDKTVLVDFALGAMNELLKMVHVDEPLWIKIGNPAGDNQSAGTSNNNCSKEILNVEEYARVASPSLALKRTGFVREATRETGIVVINSLAIVETMMDVNRWAETFNGMVSRCSTLDVISYGVAGTKDGNLLMMQADFQVISPMVPVRQAKFLRFCKQHAEGVWAVVDVSLDSIHDGSSSSSSYTFPTSTRLPSGCVLQDLPNGCCKVTWVEHSEYDETYIHRLMRPVVSSGVGFGAKRWIATLQRYCECIAILLSCPSPDQTPGKKSAMKLASRMLNSFCSGICDSSNCNWEKVTMMNSNEDVKVMMRNNANEPGEPRGVVLSASTTVWLPVSRQRMFEFLSNVRTRSEWDVLGNGAVMQEMLRMVKGQTAGNCLYVLRAATPVLEDGSLGEDNQIVVLQETVNDAAGSMVVYAPVDVQSMEAVLNGGEGRFVALLPSGFVVLPDGHGGVVQQNDVGGEEGQAGGGGGGEGMVMSGCVVTIGFQILVNNLPVGKLAADSVDTVNNLLACTIQRIKDSLHLPQ
ncbi:unnamed protein product [Linum trigynum]|uniref:Uncharacterized protein n=1 Tax=Linum trigynum TaxID=586398 RepID=A0AAV2G2Z1_9ROSI